MNQAVDRATKVAYLAALIDTSCSMCIFGGDRLALDVKVRPHLLEGAAALIAELGYRCIPRQGGAYTSIRFLDAEIGKLAMAVSSYLRGDRSKRYAELACAWWRTVQKPGVKLSEAQREERRRIAREIAEMRGKAVAV